MLRIAHYLLTWLLFLGVYVGNFLPKAGPLRIPVAIGGLAAVILFFLNFNKIRFQHLLWILALTALCLVSITLRAYTLPEMSIHGHLIRQVMSWGVLVYAIFIGYSAYLELTHP